MADGSGRVPGRYGGDFARVRGNASGGDAKSEILNLEGMELALVRFSIQVMSPQRLQNQLYVLFVFFLVVGVDEDVVQVNDDEDVEVGGKDGVNQALENGWGVGESEGHDEVLE